MRIFDLALKDLSQIFRDKKSLLFLVAMPVIFTIFMGFAYRNGSSQENGDNRILLGVVNPEPELPLNRELFARLENSTSMRVVEMKETEALTALREGKIAGVLLIPIGFNTRSYAGEVAQLILVSDPVSADGQSLFQLLRTPITQLMSAVEISRESMEIVAAQDASAEQSAAFELAWGKWNAASQLSLVRIEQAIAAPASDWTGGNPYNQSSPGILVMFAIFGLVTSAQILVQERKSRTLQRLVTTAMKPWQIVAGHLLAMFTITFMQTAMLVVFGQLVLNVDYLREPLGILLLGVSLGLWIASLGLLIGVIAKEEQQVVLYSMVAMFLFSALGGAWFPLESSGGAFAAVGRLTPSAWAMSGFQNILIRGLGLGSVWTAVAVMSVYALFFFVLAVWRFGKMEA
jgi:ABC-2 type transport system permease protein